jgi:hypothetical protein
VTATALTSTPDKADVGQVVTFTAAVTPSTAAGTVAFTGNGVPIAGCAAQPIAAGIATCTTMFAAHGDVSIVASYGGSVTPDMPIAVEVARYQSGASFVGAGGAAQATRIQ